MTWRNKNDVTSFFFGWTKYAWQAYMALNGKYGWNDY